MITSAIAEAITSSRRSEPRWPTPDTARDPAGTGTAVASSPPVLLCHTAMVTASRTAADATKTAKNKSARRTRIVRGGRRGRKRLTLTWRMPQLA